MNLNYAPSPATSVPTTLTAQIEEFYSRFSNFGQDFKEYTAALCGPSPSAAMPPALGKDSSRLDITCDLIRVMHERLSELEQSLSNMRNRI